MPTMTSQVIKFADTQKSRYFENATLLFCKIKNKLLLHIKGYIMAKIFLLWTRKSGKYKQTIWLTSSTEAESNLPALEKQMQHVDYVLDISVKLNGRDYKRVNSLLKINFFISVFNGLWSSIYFTNMKTNCLMW